MTDNSTINGNFILARKCSICEDVSCDHSVFKLNVQISKVRVHLNTGHKGPEGE
jgi:hypothetical protein